MQNVNWDQNEICFNRETLAGICKHRLHRDFIDEGMSNIKSFPGAVHFSTIDGNDVFRLRKDYSGIDCCRSGLNKAASGLAIEAAAETAVGTMAAYSAQERRGLLPASCLCTVLTLRAFVPCNRRR